SVAELRNEPVSPLVYDTTFAEVAARRHPNGIFTCTSAGPLRNWPSAGSAGAATTPSDKVPRSAPAAAASLRAAASPCHRRGVRKHPSSAPVRRPPPWPQLSTPADPRPAAKSASSQGTIRRPNQERSVPATPRRHPNVTDAPRTPKAIPEAPSEI